MYDHGCRVHCCYSHGCSGHMDAVFVVFLIMVVVVMVEKMFQLLTKEMCIAGAKQEKLPNPT